MKKILSIDGGGIRGLIPVTILAGIERRTQKPIAEIFDLIAGTSIGGAISLFLSKPGENGKPAYTAQDGVELLSRQSHRFFTRTSWQLVASVSGLLNRLYSHESVEDIYREYLGDRTFGRALTNVLITSYCLEDRHPYFFRSWYDELDTLPMCCVARATSAAPVYFAPAHFDVGSERKSFVDGAVFANNPAMCAYVEAKLLYPDEEEFFMLSIGTGEMTKPIPYSDAKDWGLAEWALPILTVVFDGVNDTVNSQLKQLLTNTYFRLQKPLTVASEALDEISPYNTGMLQQEAQLIMNDPKNQLDRICSFLT